MNQRLLTGILGFADPACCTVPITGCSPYAADCTGRLTSVTALPRETLRPAAPVRLHPWSVLLRLTALALAGVGITMNGWYSRSLGSTEAAGYLFLAVGVAADAVALCLPSVLDRAWQAHQRVTAAAGWLVWAITFVFAETAGIGFGSVNIFDPQPWRGAAASKPRQSRSFGGGNLTPAEIREKVQPGIVEDDSVRAISGAFISKLASPWGFDWARRLELFGALIVGIILDTFVLGLCIFGVVMAFLARSI